MAQSTVHFAVGMLAGTCVAMPPLIRAWRRKEPVSAHFRRWLLWSHGLGIYAVLPSVWRKMGWPELFWKTPWGNVFLFYPLIEHLRQGGILVGEAAIALIAGMQYLAMLAAILFRMPGADHRDTAPKP